MSPSRRNVGRPANASFHRRAFGFADRHHLFCVRARQLATAGQSTALADGSEILKLAHCPTDSCAPAHFDLSVCPSMSLASPRLHLLVATLATLPSMSLI